MGTAATVDQIMDRASAALLGTDYFQAVTLCLRSLRIAREAEDFERMARIVLPLLEARRQIRQIAVATGGVTLVRDEYDVPRPLVSGCYLIQPPLIGADAATLRETGHRLRTPVFVLAREPLTKKLRWPIVGVGEISVRTQVEPPRPLERVDWRITKDGFGDSDGDVVSLSWFEGAAEALGDAAIAKLDAGLHPWWQVDELLEALEAVPEHEKLHQRLELACREAARTERPTGRRPSALDNPFSF